MKFWMEKSFVHKTIIAIVIVLLVNFISPTISSASVGGILFQPVKDLLLVIADGIMQILQSFLFDMDVSFMGLHYEKDYWADIAGFFAGLIGGTIMIVIGLAGAPFSGGVSLAAVAAGIKLAVGTVVVSVGTGLIASYLVSNALPKDLKLPMFVISPEEMFKGKVPLLDVNFFETAQDKGAVLKDIDGDGKQEYVIEITTSTGEKVYQKSTALELKSTISKWYYALRNFAIVALLIILVYTAIRIIISSSAEDKAKYKQRLMDWLVAMCLLFFMHYIMAFAVYITQEITKAINEVNSGYGIIIGSSVGDSAEDGRKLSEYKYDNGDDVFGKNDTANALRNAGIIVPETGGSGGELLAWPSNMMGKARIELQLEPKNITEDEVLMRQFGFTVIYLALVMYTILFLFRYLKRLMMLAFLTMMAPLMAMTYPLDKMKDGSAQGFNTWLKEYLFNLLIQPVHLILYTVLIASAMDLVVDNLLYGLVALGFILQAEKLLRKFFGFDKASTVAGGSALGGALAMQGINSLSKMLGRANKNGKSGSKNGENDTKKLNARGRDKGKDTEDLFDNSFGPNNAPPALEGDREQAPEGGEVPGQMEMEGFFDNPQDGGEPLTQNRQAPAQRGAGTQAPGNNNPPTPEVNTSAIDQDLDNRGLFRYGLDRLTGDSPEERAERANQRAEERTARQNARIANRNQRNNRRNQFYAEHPWLNAGRNTGRTLAKHAKQLGKTAKYVAPRAAKFAAKTAVKGTLAGAGAVAGLTAALVSDDFSNVGKYTMAGLGSGYAAGIGATNIPKAFDGLGDKAIDAAEKEYAATHTQSEVKARQNAKADALWLRDNDTVEKYAQKLNVTRKEAKQIMKTEAKKYREYGITDDSIIIDSMKADGFGTGRDSYEKILLAQMSSEVTKAKEVDDLEDRLVKKRNIAPDVAKKYANEIKKQHNWA